tara:strand:+ start:358 stop:462 length:105 start_codon:yes stop_codon:yes gene_type:complete
MKNKPYGKLRNVIMYNHYLWCKENGRDVSWYEGR